VLAAVASGWFASVDEAASRLVTVTPAATPGPDAWSQNLFRLESLARRGRIRLHVLEKAGLRALFSVVVGADQTERSKPNPEPYLTAFAQMRQKSGRDLVPWRSVAIEDSKWGLISARGADLRCVAVTNTYSEAELRSDAELVVPGLHALTIAALDALCAD
jgi:beta-phosphoglucomutase-like phosphatase (HAD superfamily)